MHVNRNLRASQDTTPSKLTKAERKRWIELSHLMRPTLAERAELSALSRRMR